MNRRRLTVLMVATFFIGAAPLSPAEILAKVDALAQPQSSHMLIEQTIETTGGGVRSFTIESWSSARGEKSVMRFLAPAPSRGIGMLALEHGDNIWVYFPDSDDLRKIAGSARNQSLQGSDFSYDDMAGGEFARRYRAQSAAADTLDGKKCIKLALTPHTPGSYRRVVLWVDGQSFIPYQALHYDEKNALVKTLLFSEWRQVKGIWTPFRMTMQNHRRDSQTVIRILKVSYNRETDAEKFTTRFLTAL